MRTYTHGLLTAVLANQASRWGGGVDRQGVIAGAIVPDVPLLLLSAGYSLDRRWWRPYLPDKTLCSPTYNWLFANDPWWIIAHNSFHAPLMLLLLAGVGFLGRRQRWGRWLLWFVVGCVGHTAVDMATHVNDGPLLRFPLDWQNRFRGPVSYWDEAHGGRWVRVVEHVMDLVLLFVWWRQVRTAAVGGG